MTNIKFSSIPKVLQREPDLESCHSLQIFTGIRYISEIFTDCFGAKRNSV